MKRKIIISLFLFAIVCGATIWAYSGRLLGASTGGLELTAIYFLSFISAFIAGIKWNKKDR